MTEPYDTPPPKSVIAPLDEMFRELEAELRAENRHDLNTLADIAADHEQRLRVAAERTQMLAEKLATVVLALVEADAALMARVARLERALEYGEAVLGPLPEHGPRPKKKRRWPFGRD